MDRIDTPATDGDDSDVSGVPMEPSDKRKAKPSRKRKAKKRPIPNNSDHFPLTDTGLAERFNELHGQNVRYCHLWGKYLIWDGQRWKIDNSGMAEYLAKRAARSILTEASQEEDKYLRSALIDFAKASESATRRAAMLKLAQCEPGIPILPTDLDLSAWKLNCSNGTLNLKTGELHPHDRGDLITKLCPVAFDPAATCPLWGQFLDRIFSSNTALIKFVQRVFGICLTGDTSEQILLVYHGIGANGKSVLLNTQLAMMGLDYAMQAPPDLLMAKSQDSHPTERADLFVRSKPKMAGDWPKASSRV
jgi:putative DNA primase/helicase